MDVLRYPPDLCSLDCFPDVLPTDATSQGLANKNDARILPGQARSPVDPAPALESSMLLPPWKLTLHLRTEIETPEGVRDQYVIVRASRDPDGSWRLSTQTDGGPPVEVSGESETPTVVVADGAVMMVFPQAAASLQLTPTNRGPTSATAHPSESSAPD